MKTISYYYAILGSSALLAGFVSPLESNKATASTHVRMVVYSLECLKASDGNAGAADEVFFLSKAQSSLSNGPFIYKRILAGDNYYPIMQGHKRHESEFVDMNNRLVGSPLLYDGYIQEGETIYVDLYLEDQDNKFFDIGENRDRPVPSPYKNDSFMGHFKIKLTRTNGEIKAVFWGDKCEWYESGFRKYADSWLLGTLPHAATFETKADNNTDVSRYIVDIHIRVD